MIRLGVRLPVYGCCGGKLSRKALADVAAMKRKGGRYYAGPTWTGLRELGVDRTRLQVGERRIAGQRALPIVLPLRPKTCAKVDVIKTMFCVATTGALNTLECAKADLAIAFWRRLPP